MSGEPREVEPGCPEWPPRLTHLQQAPARLWLWGLPLPPAPVVAVVGSRRATVTGLAVARDLGRELGESGVTVVSGMALGIDGAAHEGCLDGGGFTVAVLGCGIDRCYPPRHVQLRDTIAATGCVISEEEPGTEPYKSNFPKRNRLIAALASAVVVVEATARSGALSTARWAADLGREVLAVPGSIRSPQSHGTNLLIRDGARPFLGIDDLWDAVPELGGGILAAPEQIPAPARRRRLAPPLAEILRAMGTDPVHPDQLGTALRLTASVVAARLAALELSGAVTSLPGGLVARTVGA